MIFPQSEAFSVGTFSLILPFILHVSFLLLSLFTIFPTAERLSVVALLLPWRCHGRWNKKSTDSFAQHPHYHQYEQTPCNSYNSLFNSSWIKKGEGRCELLSRENYDEQGDNLISDGCCAPSGNHFFPSKWPSLFMSSFFVKVSVDDLVLFF